MNEVIKLKAKVDKKMYYDDPSSFGVFALTPITNEFMVNLNKRDNFVVNGNMPELLEGQEYDITIKETVHPKYGKGYSMVSVGVKEYVTVEDQQAYMRAVINERYAEAIIAKYPNEKIIDLIKEDKLDYSDIKGIGNKTYQTIKHKLITNIDIQKAITELKDLKITFSSMKKLIYHFGDAEIVVDKIKKNIYELCTVPQYGFSKVDEYAMTRGDDKFSSNRIDAAVEYILKQEENNGHTWVSAGELAARARDLLQIDSSYIVNRFEELKDHSSKEKKLYIEDDKVAIYKNYYYEKRIKEILMEMIESDNNLPVHNFESKLEYMEKENGFKYTDEQRSAIEMAVKNNVLVLNGKAGTGKSFTVQGIVEALNDYQHACCALSGKASKILSAKGLDAMTIHRMLKYEPNKGFEYKENKKLPYDIIVLDEAGMCSSYLVYSILSAIKEGAKLIIVGDSGQLSPIGGGNVFDDLLNSPSIPKQELTVVQRQAQKSGILSAANEINEGKQIIKSEQYERKTFGELKDLHVLPTRDRSSIRKMIIKIAEKCKDKDDFQVICGSKQRGELSSINLNAVLQRVFNNINKPSVKRGSYEYREGDKVMQIGNNYLAGFNEDVKIFNGTIGKIVDIEFAKNKSDADKLHIKFEDIEEIICYEYSELDQIELAYAITCHKSQGSTIKNVLFVFGYDSYKLLSKQFIYTGITRASKGCVMLCELKALRYAIKTDHSGQRNTFLKSMLNKIN